MVKFYSTDIIVQKNLTQLDAVVQANRARNHRTLIWVNSNPVCALHWAQQIHKYYNIEAGQTLWIGSRLSEDTSCESIDAEATQVTMADSQRYLGTEQTNLIFNAHDSFDCDAFAAMCGTLSGGSIIVLLTPPATAWADMDQKQKDRVAVQGFSSVTTSRFIRRFERLLSAACTASGQSEAAALDIAQNYQSRAAEIPAKPSTAALTGQHQLIVKLHNALRTRLTAENPAAGKASEIHAIIADRGRGKSAALGILAANLSELYSDNEARQSGIAAADQKQYSDSSRSIGSVGVEPIILTGPGKRSVRILLKHYRENTRCESTPVFVPPDVLIREHPQASLLIVDEAAAIALPILKKLLQRYPTAVLASTVQGYEGAGRGFALRLEHLLQSIDRNVIWHKLHYPIRWADQDPLEHFINSSLLTGSAETTLRSFNSACRARNGYPRRPLPAPWPSTQSDTEETSTQPSFEKIDITSLENDEKQLSAVFNLLVQAHYQSKPMDLRHLLDGANLELFVLRLNGALLATSLVAIEGPLNAPEIRSGILNRSRRPRGHQLTQLLAQWNLREAALDLKLARIVRIAVDPACQRCGHGRLMLENIKAHFASRLDGVGALYGQHTELDRFWSNAGFQPFYRGFRRNKSSGLHSIAVLLAFSPAGEGMASRAFKLFYDYRYLLPGYLYAPPKPDPVTFKDDMEIAHAYRRSARSLANSAINIHRLYQLACEHGILSAPAISLPTLAVSQDTKNFPAILSSIAIETASDENLNKPLKDMSKKECDLLLRQALSKLLAQLKTQLPSQFQENHFV